MSGLCPTRASIALITGLARVERYPPRTALTERWAVIVTPAARRDLDRLDPPIRRRVVEALDRLALDPLSAPLRRLKVLVCRRIRATTRQLHLWTGRYATRCIKVQRDPTPHQLNGWISLASTVTDITSKSMPLPPRERCLLVS